MDIFFSAAVNIATLALQLEKVFQAEVVLWTHISSEDAQILKIHTIFQT